MIPIEIEEMFFEDRSELMIPAQDVAVLRTEHPLHHAMLMLSNSFSKLPVLDEDNHVYGALTMKDIVQATVSTTGYDLERLNGLKVKDIHVDPIGIVNTNASMEELLRELQDSNFICVKDDNEQFVGIITRKEVMARVNRCFHTLHKLFDFHSLRDTEEGNNKSAAISESKDENETVFTHEHTAYFPRFAT